MSFYDTVFDEERPLRGLMFLLIFLLPFPFSYVFVENTFSRSSSEGLVLFWSVFLVLAGYGVLGWLIRKSRSSASDDVDVSRREV
jgi:hypothetical protein